MSTHTFNVQITVTLPEGRAWIRKATQLADSVLGWLRICLNLNSVGSEHFDYRTHMSPREQRDIDIQTWGSLHR